MLLCSAILAYLKTQTMFIWTIWSLCLSYDPLSDVESFAFGHPPADSPSGLSAGGLPNSGSTSERDPPPLRT